MECINKSIEINPQDPKNWMVKGDEIYRRENYEEAISAYNKGLECLKENT
jgi:tetratricopeptide (TPR) repeat protein